MAGDLLKIIRKAVDEMGTGSPDSAAVPNNSRAVTRDNLKIYCKTMGWQDERENNAFRAVLSTTLSQLRSKGAIGFDSTWVWCQ